MASQPVKDIEAALRDMESLATSSSSPSRSTSNHRDKQSKKRTGKKKKFNPISWLIKTTLTLAVLIVLPFVVLIRLALHLHVYESLNIWLAMAASVLGTTLILLIYVTIVQKWFTGSWNVTRRNVQFVLAIVVLYSGYSLMYVSGSNVKSEDVASTYLSLHPTLRLATSTLVLLDPQAVVTDMGRTPDDYIKMGLPVKNNSLHYKQDSGFVEAVDIRTKGKPAWLNIAVKGYFQAMGFETLRHVGTEDHLHVEVPR